MTTRGKNLTNRNVLVLDALGSVSRQLRELTRDDLKIFYATSITEIKALLAQRPFCAVLVVFGLRPAWPLDEIEQILSGPSNAEWIALAESQTLEDAEFQSFVLRAFHDHHTLPIDFLRLIMSIGHACGRSQLRTALASNHEVHSRFGIYGSSPVMKAFLARLDKVIRSDVPVLIGGETGTGKELVAKAIHQFSKRSTGPLVVVNCGAIPANLIQSELFGHEKGAFTGATQRHTGKIEAAKGGVLFLDEIGDLPLDMQVSLLRVLQERAICRVGSSQLIPVDFRVIAATHVNLLEAIEQGRFREDLYYRLNVLHLELPPLRERDSDITLLAETVLKKYAVLCKNSRVRGFSKETLRTMQAYNWPGNVRELINRVQRAIVMSENRLLSPADMGLDTVAKQLVGITLDSARESFDRNVLEASLRTNGHKVAQTARQLGVSRVTLYRMMNKLSIPLSQAAGQSTSPPGTQAVGEAQ
jgi:DNA-binding NtrC family response regulator